MNSLIELHLFRIAYIVEIAGVVVHPGSVVQVLLPFASLFEDDWGGAWVRVRP